MRRPSPLLRLALLAILQCTLLSYLPGRAQPAAKMGWILEQNSSALGKLKITVTPSLFLLENAKAGTISFASAPDWRVTTYNATRKIYYSLPRQNFTGRFAMWTGTLNRHNLSAIQFIKGKKERYKDTLAQELLPSNDRANKSKQSEEQIWNPHIKIVEDSSLPKEALQIICKLYFLPPVLDGLPVECEAFVESSSRSTNRKLKEVLSTSLLQHTLIGPECLKHPDLSTYRRLNDEVSFANANNGDSVDLKDFTDYMGH